MLLTKINSRIIKSHECTEMFITYTNKANNSKYQFSVLTISVSHTNIPLAYMVLQLEHIFMDSWRERKHHWGDFCGIWKISYLLWNLSSSLPTKNWQKIVIRDVHKLQALIFVLQMKRSIRNITHNIMRNEKRTFPEAENRYLGYDPVTILHTPVYWWSYKSRKSSPEMISQKLRLSSIVWGFIRWLSI